MSDLQSALFLTVLLSALLAFVQVLYSSQSDVRSCLSVLLVPYMLIEILGGLVMTVITFDALHSAQDGLRVVSNERTWFLSPFLGVFGFSGIVQNVNVSFLETGVLMLREWTAKARGLAVAKAVEKQTLTETERPQEIAQSLLELTDEDLNAQISMVFEPSRIDELETRASEVNANSKFLKALAFAYEDPDRAEAIVKQA